MRLNKTKLFTDSHVSYSYLNTSAPFDLHEHNAVWKHPRYMPWGFEEYTDFSVCFFARFIRGDTNATFQWANDWNSTCELPTLWLNDGSLENVGWGGGCMMSDFDQYGDMEAFGVHPDWQRQLTKFASVQDRLREWRPEVLAKLKNFVCMTITALDVDAIRIDKATQVTVDALAEWAASARSCASALGKTNFYITGEVTGGDHFGSLY